MNKKQRMELRELAKTSTKVVAWYAHGREGGLATVRGPFVRWFECTEVLPQYEKSVADPLDDCRFAAAAMNNLIPLLDEIDRLEAALQSAQTSLATSNHQ